MGELKGKAGDYGLGVSRAARSGGTGESLVPLDLGGLGLPAVARESRQQPTSGVSEVGTSESRISA